MRILLSIASIALIASSASAQQYSHETGTYRYGGTYKQVQATSATSCAALCSQESVCRSWSFQRATRGLGSAVCELKAIVGTSVKNPLMVSGINPLIASQGQASVRSVPTRTTGTLLGASQRAPAQTVIRNSTVRSLPPAPRPLAPPQTFTPPPPPAPAPIINRAPTPTFTPPSRTLPPPPTITRAPAPVVRAPAAPIVTRQPTNIRTPAPVAPRPAPIIQATPQAAPIIRAAPAPRAPVAPVVSRAVTLPPPPVQRAPTPVIQADGRVQVPVTQGALPPGAILRETPPPLISFEPPAALPTPAGTTVSAAPPIASIVSATPPRPVVPAAPIAPASIPAPTVTPEIITLPRSSKTKSTPKLLNTVPAGSIPTPAPDPNKPYQNLSNREFPEFSVNNNTVLSPDQFEAQIAAEAAGESAPEGDQLFETLDSVSLGSNDLATQVGDPLAPPKQRIPGNTGSVAAGGGS